MVTLGTFTQHFYLCLNRLAKLLTNLTNNNNKDEQKIKTDHTESSEGSCTHQDFPSESKRPEIHKYNQNNKQPKSEDASPNLIV